MPPPVESTTCPRSESSTAIEAPGGAEWLCTNAAGGTGAASIAIAANAKESINGWYEEYSGHRPERRS
jgi:hypothetical protein